MAERLVEFYIDHARYFNLALIFLATSALVANLVARREELTRRTRRTLVWIIAIFFNFLYGTGDNLQDSIRVNVPVMIATVLTAGLVVSLIWHPEGDEEFPPDDGAWTNRFIHWLDEQVKAHKAKKEAQDG